MSLFNFGSETKEESKRTIIAVVLSSVIVGVGFLIQNALFPPAPASATATTQTTSAAAPAVTGAEAPTTLPALTVVTASPEAAAKPVVPVDASAPVAESSYTIETDVIKAVFTNAGGELVSLTLKKHKDKSGNVDLIVPGSKGSNGLSVAFGAQDAAPVRELMNATWVDNARTTIQFSRTFYAKPAGAQEPLPFVFKKVYTFREGDYMFGMAITLETPDGSVLPFGSFGPAYTISLGPQIGPRFDQLSKNADYRKYILEIAGKKKVEMPKAGSLQAIKDQPSWGSIAGKYFTFIAIPEQPSVGFSYYQGQDPSIKQTNTIYLTRPAISTASQTDTYYFYFGPKTSSELAKYEYADKNPYGLSAMKLEDVTERSNILGWLESILKFFLNVFYKVIPNYGVAIILVTILIKILFFPITRKGSISTARMQELQPKMQEIQAKYKSNPQRMNQELAEFYKREKYNPMSGCLPMLIQLPLFIAMYNLFNNHFDLRGAVFIPGWISDLSLPESILNFGSFRLPIVGWNDLRALPIIYLASQLLYGKFTQTPQSGQSANQMKLMMYGMPIMFFFVLYDVPSGLLLYWIVSNVLTIVQQVIINDMLKKHKIAAALAPEDLPQQNGGAAAMKSAGKTSVKNADSAGFSDKVRQWLEAKAAEAGQAQQSAPKSGQDAKGKGGAKSGKRR